LTLEVAGKSTGEVTRKSTGKSTGFAWCEVRVFLYRRSGDLRDGRWFQHTAALCASTCARNPIRESENQRHIIRGLESS